MKAWPSRWGCDGGLEELFSPEVTLLHLKRRAYHARYRSIEECLEFLNIGASS